jgi:hypothetical protein
VAELTEFKYDDNYKNSMVGKPMSSLF